MSVTRKIIQAEAPSDIGERMIRFCASNEEEDRDGDILRADGCDFRNFAKNPQFLGFHNYHDFPLGTPKKWFIDRAQKKVFIDVYFPTVDELSGGKPELASEKAKLVDTTYHMYKTKMLNAVSIGFRVSESEKNGDSATMWGQIVKKWELIELSAVPVPSNQSALVESMKAFDPSGRMLEIFTEVESEEKSGRRLSASTLETIEELRKCNESIKACHKEMSDHMGAFDKLVMKLIDGNDGETEEPEADDDTVLEIDE